MLLDEGLDTGTDKLGVLKRWVYQIRSLRNKWTRLSKGQKSEGTKKAFLKFQQETFFIPDGTDHNRDRRSASIELQPTVAGSSDDGNEVVGVQDEENQ